MARELERLEGTVEHIIYHNEGNGFTIFELATDNELITVKGEIAGVGEGEELVCTGYYETHPQYGLQFKVEAAERSMPTTVNAIYKYLSSGAIKGIGASTARRIVDRFGDESLRIMESEPERLCEVKGITEAKARSIGIEFQRIYGIRTVMTYLSEFELKTEIIIAAWKKWGILTTDVVAENPFVLCEPEIGLSFEEGDRIRAAMELPEYAPCRVRAGLLHVLRHNAGNGHTCIPRGKLVETTAQGLGLDIDTTESGIEQLCDAERILCEVVGEREFVYLPELHAAEQYIAGRLSVFRTIHATQEEGCEQEILALEQDRGLVYAEAQREAIALAMREPVLILTGGPGTGKTTTLNAIITLFQQRGMKVLLAAPTGRAAKRMTELTGRPAQTIHRLLEVDFSGGGSGMKFVHNEKNPLDCHAVVIDEMSMVDVMLFEHLLRAVRLNCKLILVGDSDQLPSVGPGNVLGDLIESNRFAMVELREIFRQAAESLIVTNAHAIIEGREPTLNDRTHDFFFLQSSYPQNTAQTACDLVATRLPKRYRYSPMWDIQVLCPTRQGEIGTIALNRRLQELLNPADGLKRELQSYGVTFREGDKVMQTRNNYDIVWTRDEEEGAGVFNGDIGIIERIDKADGCFYVRYDDRLANYELELASELEHAWAITVHKSQGSEFEAVIIPLQDWHPRLYYRKLLYTAVTRAKKLLILLGRPDTVSRMIGSDRKTRRYTNLCTRICEEIEQPLLRIGKDEA